MCGPMAMRMCGFCLFSIFECVLALCVCSCRNTSAVPQEDVSFPSLITCIIRHMEGDGRFSLLNKCLFLHLHVILIDLGPDLNNEIN